MGVSSLVGLVDFSKASKIYSTSQLHHPSSSVVPVASSGRGKSRTSIAYCALPSKPKCPPAIFATDVLSSVIPIALHSTMSSPQEIAASAAKAKAASSDFIIAAGVAAAAAATSIVT